MPSSPTSPRARRAGVGLRARAARRRGAGDSAPRARRTATASAISAREAEVEARPLAFHRLDPDAPAIPLHDALHDREADAVALLDDSRDALLRRPVIQLEDSPHLILRDPDAVVVHDVVDRP